MKFNNTIDVLDPRHLLRCEDDFSLNSCTISSPVSRTDLADSPNSKQLGAFNLLDDSDKSSGRIYRSKTMQLQPFCIPDDLEHIF